MSAENDKNNLQIYCQRNGLPLPVYNQRVDATGQWTSTVTLTGKDSAESTYEGCACPRKTQSDIAAASVALKALKLSPGSEGSEGSESGTGQVIKMPRCHTIEDYYESIQSYRCTDVFVLVDYENVNKLHNLHYIFSVEGRHRQEAAIYKFLGYSHHNAESKEVSHIIHSGGSNAVDHAISMFVGMIIAACRGDDERRIPTILIVTKDQFAERLQNMSRSEGAKIIHVPSERQCVELLTSLGYTQTNCQVVYE